MKEKEPPDELPTVRGVRELLSPEGQIQLDDVCRGFRQGYFVGRLVVQWCGRCGKWRPKYVPKSKVDAIEAERVARPYFTPDPEIFPCVRCGRRLKMVLDSDHTILESE